MDALVVQKRTPLLTIEPVVFSSSSISGEQRIFEGCMVRPAANGPLCIECTLAECVAKISGVLGVLNDW